MGSGDALHRSRCLLLLVKVLVGREIVEGLMGTDGVVDDLVGSQFGGKVSDVWRGGATCIELLAEGPLQALDAPIGLAFQLHPTAPFHHKPFG